MDLEHEMKTDLTGVPEYKGGYGESGETAKWNQDPDGDWYKRPAFWTSCAAIPTAVTATAGVAEWMYTDGAVAAVEALAALGAGTLAGKSLASKWDSHLTWGAVAACAASSQALVTTVAPIGATPVAWLLGVSGTVAARLVYRHRTRNDRFERMEKYAKSQTAQIKQATAQAKLDALRAPKPVEYAPDFSRYPREESQLRQAFWDVHGVELVACTIGPTLTGYTATLALPGGLPRDTVRSQWDKVASALMANGRFVLGNGQYTNTLTARFIDADKQPDNDMTWHPGAPGIGRCTVTGDVVDVPVEGVHSMTGGRTNMGKSAYARIQLMRTYHDPKRAGVVIDPKRAEAVAWYGKLRTAGHAADVDERDAEVYDMLVELMAEFRHRQTLFPGLYWEASEDYPTLFITIDEGAALTRLSGKKEYANALEIAETLYGEGRVVGMWFNWASQYLAKGSSIPQLVKENVGATIGLTTLGPEGDRMLFGEQAGAKGWSPSELCEGVPGRALVRYQNRGPEPVALWHVTGEHIDALPDAVPWRSKAVKSVSESAQNVARRMHSDGKSLAQIAEAVGVSKSTVSRWLRAD